MEPTMGVLEYSIWMHDWELRVRPRDGGGNNIHIHVEMPFKGVFKAIGPLATG